MAKKGGTNEAALARNEEAARQAKIRDGTQKINQTFDSQFTDPFFAGRRTAYMDYANPQLQDQYGDAREQLTYALARAGTLDSSIRADKDAELQKLYDQRVREVGDQALALETDSRNAVEGARTDLIRTLQATGDAEGAANSALTRAQILSKPEAYSPLSQLFADFTAGLGVQAAQERAEAASGGYYKAPYNTGLFGSKGAVAVKG